MTQEQNKLRWFWKPSVIILALLSVGPLALPLVWTHPQFSLRKKTIWTLLTLAVTLAAVFAALKMMESLEAIVKQYRDLGIL